MFFSTDRLFPNYRCKDLLWIQAEIGQNKGLSTRLIWEMTATYKMERWKVKWAYLL